MLHHGIHPDLHRAYSEDRRERLRLVARDARLRREAKAARRERKRAGPDR